MKKVLLLLVVAIAFVACEGPEGPMGSPGMNGQDGKDGQNGQNGKDGNNGTSWVTKTFTIQPDEWELIGNPGELNSYFFVDKSLSELSKSIYEDGAVIAYIQTADEVKNGMPYVLHKGGHDADGKEIVWTQTYDFDYYPGGVGFYLTYSDFNTQLKPIEPETFHIVLMW